MNLFAELFNQVQSCLDDELLVLLTDVTFKAFRASQSQGGNKNIVEGRL